MLAGNMEAQAEVGILSIRMDRDESIASLFRHRHAACVRLAFLLTSDWELAEELVQEAFVRTWWSWSRISRTAAAPVYLRATVVNLARSSLRRRLLESRHRSGHEERTVQSPSFERLDFVKAVLSLPAQQRACIALRYYEDLSEIATAKTLGISVGTVKSHTHRALKRLQELLGGETYGQ